MKITLIQPSKPFYGSEAEGNWELSMPFSLFFLASAIENNTSFDVQIIDLEKKTYKDIILEDVFIGNDSQIFGITATTFTRFEAIKVAKCIKKLYPESWITVGGVYFSLCAEDTLRNIPEIDIVVRGEGEIILKELANAINEGRNLKDIKGITYRDNGKIVQNSDQTIFIDIDNLPFYEKFSWEEYPEYLMGYPERIPAISIMSSRGCPYRCIFCSKSGTKYRLRKPKIVVDEIEFFKNKFGVEAFNFLDLTFTANPRHVKEVCQELLGRKTNIKWWCESRANIPLELLNLMKEAGCVITVIGVESGSPRIISKIQKDISLDQVINFCKKCKEVGISVNPYFMYSHPGETNKDVKNTINFIIKLQKLGVKASSFQPTMIFPGTKIEEIARDKGILPKDFSWSAPYESDMNKELGQLSNVPLFIDALNFDTMKKLNKEFSFRVSIYDVAKDISKLSFKDLIVRGCKSIIRNEPATKYIFSPRFYYEFILSKFWNKP